MLKQAMANDIANAYLEKIAKSWITKAIRNNPNIMQSEINHIAQQLHNKAPMPSGLASQYLTETGKSFTPLMHNQSNLINTHLQHMRNLNAHNPMQTGSGMMGFAPSVASGLAADSVRAAGNIRMQQIKKMQEIAMQNRMQLMTQASRPYMQPRQFNFNTMQSPSASRTMQAPGMTPPTRVNQEYAKPRQ